jgi:formate hydrogenlyase transcriptional activator
MSVNSITAQRQHSLMENGPKALEVLLRVTAFRPLGAVPVTDGTPASPRCSMTGDGMSGHRIPARDQGCALFLLDADGRIAVWYPGAEIIYQYKNRETAGRHVSILGHGKRGMEEQEEFSRSIQEGRFIAEGWQFRKDGARFWASMIAAPLRDENGDLQGFAVVVRDFSDRRQRHEQLRRDAAAGRTAPVESAIVGVVSGEFDRIPEANDAFLELVGHSRAELQAGRIEWSTLTPKKYEALDELAQEEALRFGASAPVRKELIRKDGTTVPVSVTTAILSLMPFRWVALVTDLRERERLESAKGAADTAPILCEFLQSTAEDDDEALTPRGEIIGASAALKAVTRQIGVVAPTDATVLILGETGTGKELVARAIHRMSARKDRPFVTLNCAAIPTGLLESELFGYERGAFTGALSQKIGRFEMANQGTLFLDEVGDIPVDLQPKLLRALQEKSFERLGGTKTILINVRLMAATNRNLTQMMRDKLFRSDLYYRLKVFPITMPPLRDHPEDIPALVRHFTKKYAAKMNRTIDSIPLETMKDLVSWSWPGNVRELENFIERSVILSPGSSLRAPVTELQADPAMACVDATLARMEREHIVRVVQEAGGSLSVAATRLGLPRTTLNVMMKKLGI